MNVKKLIPFVIFLSFLVLVIAFPNPLEGNTEYRYDGNPFDSDTNTSLWINATVTGNDIFLEESATYIRVRCDAGGGNTGTLNVRTNTSEIPEIAKLGNLSLRVGFTDTDTGQAKLTTLGTDIWNTNSDGTGTSTFRINRNESNQGTNQFIVYDDGTYKQTITASDNFVYMYCKTNALNDEGSTSILWLNYTTRQSLLNTTLTIPNNNSFNLSSTIDFTANLSKYYSGFNASFVNATLYVWDSTGTTFATDTNIVTGNTTNLSEHSVASFTIDEYTWNVFACLNDYGTTRCNWDEENYNRTLTYGYLFNNLDFDSIVAEESAQTFKINLTLVSGLTSSDGYLYYNNTQYLASKSSAGPDTIYTVNLVSPPVSTTTNVPFNFQINLNDGADNFFNATSGTQEVSSISLDDCGSNTVLIINYTVRDEETRTILTGSGDNVTVEVDLGLSTLGTTDEVGSFNQTFQFVNSTAPAQVCVNAGIINSTTYRMDVQTRYEAQDHVSEFFNIQNYTLNNNTAGIQQDLYPLATADSQEFKVTFKDENFLRVEDALITVLRKYIGDGVFRTVEAPVTDSNGETIIHLVLSDVIYTIQISKDGKTLASFDNVVAICDDLTTGDCTLPLNVFTSTGGFDDFAERGGLRYGYNFDEDNRLIQLSFSTIDNAQALVSLNGTVFDNRGNNSICSPQTTAQSGVLDCNVPLTIGNATIKVDLFNDGTLIDTSFFKIDDVTSSEIFGSTGILLTLIMYMTIPLMFITSGVGVVIGAIMGLIFAGLLNLYTGGSLLGSASSIIWFIIAGAIIVWKISRRERE